MFSIKTRASPILDLSVWQQIFLDILHFAFWLLGLKALQLIFAAMDSLTLLQKFRVELVLSEKLWVSEFWCFRVLLLYIDSEYSSEYSQVLICNTLVTCDHYKVYADAGTSKISASLSR